MKRTAAYLALPLLLAAPGAPSQDGAQDPAKGTEVKSFQDLVERIRTSESAARSVSLEMRTEGSFPGGLTFETKGSMRVLKTEHLRIHTRMEFRSADGIQGAEESVRTEAGVWTLKDDPVFGEVFLHMDPVLMKDLEWAGEVLGQGGAPGGLGAASGSPLGSALVEQLGSEFEFGAPAREVRDGQEGWRVVGDLRHDVEAETAPDMPMPDRVELFVRARDAAVLEMVSLREGKPFQKVEITRLEINKPMDASSFRLDVGDRKAQDIRDYPPDWTQIERMLQDAEARSELQRPSKRQ